MSLGSYSYVWLFLAVIAAGYALYKVSLLGLAAFLHLNILGMVGIVVIVVFALAIIFIGIRVLIRGGWA